MIHRTWNFGAASETFNYNENGHTDGRTDRRMHIPAHQKKNSCISMYADNTNTTLLSI